MKIGVTGASGFIGRKLCKALIESDFEYTFGLEHVSLLKVAGSVTAR